MFSLSGIGWDALTIIIALMVLTLLVSVLSLRIIQQPEPQERLIPAGQKIEKLQLEKTEEIYRLAEFGRLNASLLHDIATPLTAVSMNVGLIEDSSYPITTIREGIKSMEEYLASARMRLQGHNSNGTFSPLLEIKKVVRLAESTGASIEVNVAIDEIIQITGDSTRFDQALSNLLSNALDAVKHKASKGKVRLEACSDGHTLIVSVSDNGLGIDESELDSVFHPFYTTKAKSGGTGLGLSIVKQVAEEFNGSVAVHSDVGGGSRFTLRIPR